MAASNTHNFRAIKEMRDEALLLSLANRYLCEEPYLKRIGLEIEKKLKQLRTDISFLKKRFPGRFVKEVDTDQALEGIHRTAQLLQQPDKDLSKKCTVGELGLELEAGIDDLVEAVDALRVQVEGEVSEYTVADSILRQVARIKSAAARIVRLSNLIIKTFILLILAASVPFTYLLVTMETEKDLTKATEQSKMYIQSQQQLLTKLGVEKEELAKKIDAMSKGELGRQEKVQIMDLDMKLYKLKEEGRKAKVEISIHGRKIKENQKRIEALRKKSFLERLLRL